MLSLASHLPLVRVLQERGNNVKIRNTTSLKNIDLGQRYMLSQMTQCENIYYAFQTLESV
jgi:hypothetical protein